MTSLTNHLNRAGASALLAIVAATSSLLHGSAVAAPPAKPLAELESHIQWSAVDGAWKEIRPGWATKTAACGSADCVAAQLLLLEQHVEWKAVNPKWKERRPAWVKECQSATTDAQAAGLLLEFEQNVGWNAVDEKWKAMRDDWIARVKGS